MRRYLAFDFGAESGRAMLGTLDGAKLTIEQLHRFPNEPVRLPTGLYWDTLRLFHEIRRGLTIACRERHVQLDAIGIDTWGVDFGLLGSDGALVDNPHHYRCHRTDGVPEQLFQVVPWPQVFEQTGIQFMPINSLYQWYSMHLAGSPALQAADRLLFIPDLFNYWLTGVAKAEVTIASTSQFYDPRSRTFAVPMLEHLCLNPRLLPDLVEPGTLLGPLLPELAESTGLGPVPVYASAGHDTAAAVAAVPAEGNDWCYISSGTWSLMGVEVDHPVLTPEALALNFTNEIGVGGKVRLLKNIAGLWLLQECRRSWTLEGHEYRYEDLVQFAEEAGPSPCRLDVDAFSDPGDMPRQIANWCRKHSQPVPQGPGQFARAIFEGLAERYRQVLENLEALTGHRIHVIHIVGGGSRNELLNRLTAEATGRRVIPGPVEATAMGNLLVQAIGTGAVRNLAQAREIVRQSIA